MSLAALFESLVFQYFFPLLYTIVFVTFIWGLLTYVIAGGPDEHAKERGRTLLLYSLVAFGVVTFLWSLVAMARDILGS